MSAVDRYLDEMFDRLSGTGMVGRRAMAEIEDHLRTAVAAAVAQGADEDLAACDAVARFGPAAQVAAQLRRTHRRAPGGVVLSASWVLAGLASAVIGLAHLGYATSIGITLWLHPEPRAACLGGSGVMLDCSSSTTALKAAGLRGAVVLAIAVAVLLSHRGVAARFPRLLPSLSGRDASVLAALLALSGVVLVAGRVDLDAAFGAVPGPGLRIHVITAGFAAMAAVALAVWASSLRHRVTAG